MHVIKEQRISFKDDKKKTKKRKEEKKNSDTHTRTTEQKLKIRLRLRPQSGTKRFEHKGPAGGAVGSIALATALLLLKTDFPSTASCWGYVCFQPRGGAVPVRRFLSWDTVDQIKSGSILLLLFFLSFPEISLPFFFFQRKTIHTKLKRSCIRRFL